MSNFYSETLINWYKSHQRDLPWRQTKDPYKIWISEVILQQTRVDQGLGYYIRFTERFPTVEELAQANEDEVLKYWQGLGYYSRARNLHKAAKQIMELHHGIFPATHKEIKALSGIGDYTAAAVCSLAYNQAHAVLDGNVYRILSRLFDIETPIDSTSGKTEFSELATELLDRKNPDTHNQAIMDFGAIQCTPAAPACVSCPFAETCLALQRKTISSRPVKSKKTKVIPRYFNYFQIIDGQTTYIQKRTKNDVWKNLYEFPLIETDHLAETDELMASPEFIRFFGASPDLEIHKTTHPMKHVLSHRVIYAHFYTIKVKTNIHFPENWIRIPIEDIEQYPVSRLMDLFIKKEF